MRESMGREDLAGEYCRELAVPDAAIDENGHVNNVAYVQWMQDAATAHFTAVGGLERMREAGGSWVVRSHRIEYLSPAFVGDRIAIYTWIEEYRRVRSRRGYRFERPADGTVLARGETEWVYVDAETGRPAAIPDSIRKAAGAWGRSGGRERSRLEEAPDR